MCYNVPMAEHGKILAVDFGTRRVGLAVSDELGILASPLETYRATAMRNTIDYVTALAKKLSVKAIVVGLPLMQDGTDSEQTLRVRAFIRNLQRVSGIEVVEWDERFTTVEGYDILKDNGLKLKESKQKIDAVAACLILQAYLDSQRK